MSDLSGDVEKFWSLSLPALGVSTGQLAERLEGGTSLVLVLLERLDDDVEEKSENGGELEGDGRVINARDEGRDGLEGGNTNSDFAVLEGALENLHELSLGARKLLAGQVHLRQNLKDIHGKLAALD